MAYDPEAPEEARRPAAFPVPDGDGFTRSRALHLSRLQSRDAADHQHPSRPWPWRLRHAPAAGNGPAKPSRCRGYWEEFRIATESCSTPSARPEALAGLPVTGECVAAGKGSRRSRWGFERMLQIGWGWQAQNHRHVPFAAMEADCAVTDPSEDWIRKPAAASSCLQFFAIIVRPHCFLLALQFVQSLGAMLSPHNDETGRTDQDNAARPSLPRALSC